MGTGCFFLLQIVQNPSAGCPQQNNQNEICHFNSRYDHLSHRPSVYLRKLDFFCYENYFSPLHFPGCCFSFLLQSFFKCKKRPAGLFLQGYYFRFFELRRLLRVSNSSLMLIGLETKPFIPAFITLSRSSLNALAVRAMMVTDAFPGSSR